MVGIGILVLVAVGIIIDVIVDVIVGVVVLVLVLILILVRIIVSKRRLSLITRSTIPTLALSEAAELFFARSIPTERVSDAKVFTGITQPGGAVGPVIRAKERAATVLRISSTHCEVNMMADMILQDRGETHTMPLLVEQAASYFLESG